jgi:hypothetical protein
VSTTRRVWLFGLRTTLVVVLGLIAQMAHAQGEFGERSVERQSLSPIQEEQLERRFAEAKAGQEFRRPPSVSPKLSIERLTNFERVPPSRDFVPAAVRAPPRLSISRSWADAVRSGAPPALETAPPKNVVEQLTRQKGVVVDRQSQAVWVAPDSKKPAEPITKFNLQSTGPVAPQPADDGAVKLAATVAAREKPLFGDTIFESPGHVALGVQSGEHSVPVLFATNRFRLAAPHEKAIAAIADISSGPLNSADRHLRNLGFELPTHPRWAHLSAVEKIRSACEAAEIAAAKTQAPGQATTAVLAKMSRSLAQQYAAVRAEKDLEPYLRYPAPDKIAFAAAGSGSTAPPEAKWLKAPERVAIAKLANYAESGVGSLGGYGILTKHVHLSDDAAFNLLRSSGSVEKALTDAIAPLGPDARDLVLAGAVQDYAEAYTSLRSDPDLAPYLQSRFSPETSPATGELGPRGPPARVP